MMCATHADNSYMAVLPVRAVPRLVVSDWAQWSPLIIQLASCYPLLIAVLRLSTIYTCKVRKQPSIHITYRVNKHPVS